MNLAGVREETTPFSFDSKYPGQARQLSNQRRTSALACFSSAHTVLDDMYSILMCVINIGYDELAFVDGIESKDGA